LLKHSSEMLSLDLINLIRLLTDFDSIVLTLSTTYKKHLKLGTYNY